MENQLLNILVIDDDPLITDLISHFCEKADAINSCITCNNGIEGLRLWTEGDYDILYLDYNMPDLNGKAILELNQDNGYVVMITSEEKFAVESYNYDCIIDFLLKPITYDRFLGTLSKLPRKSKEESSSTLNNEDFTEKLYLKDGKKWIPVSFNEILYVKSESNYLHVQTGSESIMTLMNLKDFITQAPNYFKQVHRSYLINALHIDYITVDEVNIKGKNIPISSKYKGVVKEITQS